MGKHKSRTEAEKSRQKARTHFNKKRKYEKLIKERPQDIHRKEWEKKLAQL